MMDRVKTPNSVSLSQIATRGFHIPGYTRQDRSDDVHLDLFRAPQRLGITWFEEPLLYHDVAGDVTLRRQCGISLAIGEYDVPLLCSIPDGLAAESFDWIDALFDQPPTIASGLAWVAAFSKRI